MKNKTKKSHQGKVDDLHLKKIKELEKGWQRTQADFENFRKKVESEKLANLAYAKAEFASKITPVLDNFQLAFKNSAGLKNDPQWVEGVKQIKIQLEDILTEEGLKKISAQRGEKFDPQYHEAISFELNNLAEDLIIDEVESGWMFEEKIIKPAKVRVSQGK